MNMRLVALCLTLYCLAVPGRVVKASQKPAPADKLWVAAEKDVIGDWQTQGEGWKIVINADHSAAVYFEGVFESKPSLTTWKLVRNHVIISNANLFRTGYYKDLGNDFILVPYRNQFVMLSKKDMPVAEKRGFAACNCLWRSARKSDRGKY